MAKILPFTRGRIASRGTVHVMPSVHGFEIGHESASGGSWGSFDVFPDAQAAIVAAYQLNALQYGGACDVRICAEALGAVDTSTEPRGAF